MMTTTVMTAATRRTQAAEAEVQTPFTSFREEAAAAEKGLSLEEYLRERMPLDLSELAQDVVAQMLTEGRLEQVDIHYHLPKERVRVGLPRPEFAQVVEHMVASAAQAMKSMADRKHVLRVIVEPEDAFGDFGPRLRVQDTGASAIIEDAMQAAIARVEQMGARMTVKPRPTGGNIFTVELPKEGRGASW